MMTDTNKKVLGWAFVVSLILFAMLLRTGDEPVIEESVVDEIVEEVVEEEKNPYDDGPDFDDVQE